MRDDPVVFRSESIPNNRDSIEDGNAGMGDALSFTDQSGEQHSLPIRDGQFALHFPLRNRRREIGGSRGRSAAGRKVVDHGADFLLDVEKDGAVGIHPRLNLQDDAGILVINCVHDSIVGAEHCCAACRYRHLVAHFKRRGLVINDHERRIRQDLDVGVLVQSVDDDPRRERNFPTRH